MTEVAEGTRPLPDAKHAQSIHDCPLCENAPRTTPGADLIRCHTPDCKLAGIEFTADEWRKLTSR